MARKPTIKNAVRREMYISKELDRKYGKLAAIRGVSKAHLFRVGLEAGLSAAWRDFSGKPLKQV